MDGGTIAAIISASATVLGGFAAVGKILVDRHLAALSRLEARAEANTAATVQVAATLDAIREHLVDIRRGQERTARHVVRLLDHAGLPEHEPSIPTPPPSEIPRGRAITGSYPSLAAAAGGVPRE